ncbi:MAG: hypothetical protein GC164_03350 [Phycisphaera sp.]|nr:hypothetical protein [Phycisphaera sp.]
MRTVVLLLFVAVLLLPVGCGQYSQPVAGSPVRNGLPLPSVQAFEWGEARIAVGMNRHEALEQIARSGLLDWNGQYGITPPPAAMETDDTWQLTYGNGSGAAPGGGMLTIRFKDGKVVEIVPAAVFA